VEQSAMLIATAYANFYWFQIACDVLHNCNLFVFCRK